VAESAGTDKAGAWPLIPPRLPFGDSPLQDLFEEQSSAPVVVWPHLLHSLSSIAFMGPSLLQQGPHLRRTVGSA
jgi:hypothetical protein